MSKNFYARVTPWGSILFGDKFKELTLEEQEAVLAHEQGHLEHRHAWKRLKWLLTFRVFRDLSGFFEMCVIQELEADRYAVEKGHLIGLVSFLQNRASEKPGVGYPTPAQRLEVLRG